ncbi:MAG: Pr6Pr family membrane protein [Methylocella sp.]
MIDSTVPRGRSGPPLRRIVAPAPPCRPAAGAGPNVPRSWFADTAAASAPSPCFAKSQELAIFDESAGIKLVEEGKMHGVGEPKVHDNSARALFRQRRCAAVLAGLGWFALSVSLYFDVHGAVVKNLSIPVTFINFFSYFTTETVLLITLGLTIFCNRPQAEQFLTAPSVQSALVVYIIVVGGVYAVLLRNLWHPHGLQILTNFVLHDAIPVLYPMYWLVFLPKGSLRWSAPAWWVVYPVMYFLYSMLRGAAFGTYVYPFMDAAKLGVARAWLNGAFLLAVFFCLGVVLTAIDHALASGESGRRGLGRAAEL